MQVSLSAISVCGFFLLCLSRRFATLTVNDLPFAAPLVAAFLRRSEKLSPFLFFFLAVFAGFSDVVRTDLPNPLLVS